MFVQITWHVDAKDIEKHPYVFIVVLMTGWCAEVGICVSDQGG